MGYPAFYWRNITVITFIRAKGDIDMDIKEPVLSTKSVGNLIEVLSVLIDIVDDFGVSKIPDKIVLALRNNIKELFPDYNLSMMYISDNTDKELFGIFINRKFNIGNMLLPEDMRDITEREMVLFDIDIDSKLFTMGFDAREIASFIIYDLYKILSYDATLDVVAAYDAICAGRESSFNKKIVGKVPMENLFKFCASDYLYRSRSIFSCSVDYLIRIPDILAAYGLDEVFMQASDKLVKHDYMMNKTCKPPAALSLNWMMSAVYRYTDRSTEILDTLRDFMDTSGSTLINSFAKIIAKQLVDATVRFFRKEIATEASLFAGIRKNGLKSLENDLFEYEMRVKNIEDENSAIFLMRQINSRMSIIQDYLDEEDKIPEAEMKRWQKIYDRYEKLRIQMTNKPIYSKKMYGLFVDYNALMTPGNDNMMTMNTVY